MTIALACLIAVAAIAFVLGVRPKDLPTPEPESPFAHLDERKAAIYENLRDLQFEYRLGKLSDTDYQNTKKDLQKELAAVLEEVDRLRGVLSSSGPSAGVARAGRSSAVPSSGATAPGSGAVPSSGASSGSGASGSRGARTDDSSATAPGSAAVPSSGVSSGSGASGSRGARTDGSSATAPGSPAPNGSGPAEPLTPQPTGLICPSCGAKFERELKFCGECGKPMKAASA